MGINIICHTQRRVEGCWQTASEHFPFDEYFRQRDVFTFLAGIPNSAGITPPFELRGLPSDAPPEWGQAIEDFGFYGVSWLSLEELLAFNYDEAVEDRSRRANSAAGLGGYIDPCPPGQGGMTTWREFVGENFFDALEELQGVGSPASDVRIVFWFTS